MDKLELKIKWENGVEVSVQQKRNDDEWITVVALEENGCIEVLWPNIQKALEVFFKHTLTVIGTEMKS